MKLSESVEKIAAEIEKKSQVVATLTKDEVVKALERYWMNHYGKEHGPALLSTKVIDWRPSKARGKGSIDLIF
jgi:hypothetical protein